MEGAVEKTSGVQPSNSIAQLTRTGALLQSAAAVARTARKFGSAIVDARQSLSFLRNLKQMARTTANRCERSGAEAPWRLRLDRAAERSRFVRGLKEVLLEERSPRYAVKLRHAPLSGRRPRILHVIPNVFVGGSTQLVVDLHEHLGHRYDMVVLTAALPPGGVHDGMYIQRIGLDEPTHRFAPAIAAARPDLVHVHYWGSTDEPWYAPAFEAALAAGIPVVQNVNTPVRPFIDGRIRRTVFVSDYVRSEFGPDIAGGVVIYPGIDLDRFRPEEAYDRDARDTAIMVYRLDRDKLDPDAIDPAIEAVRLRPRTRIVVVGEGPLLPVFLRRVEAAGVRANFDFRGYVPYRDLPQLYGAASAFLAPVARESFGQVVPFAMAMGLAIVGNHVGALPEILESSEMLGNSPAETGALLARVLDDEAKLRRLGAVNRRRAQAFSIKAMTDAYDALYGEVLAVSAQVAG